MGLSATVEVVHFNPRRLSVKGVSGRYDPRLPRLNNFGDLLGPLVVAAVRRNLGLDDEAREPGRRLLSVGSILKLAQPGDVVWGSGVNGKSLAIGAQESLDVRAVRGPRTRAALLAAGVPTPEVFGDPGLLVPLVWPRESTRVRTQDRAVVWVPNFRETAVHVPPDVVVVDPLSPIRDVVRTIANAALVLASSLHGVVVAEAYGVPARLVRSRVEPSFKYDDYYEATGRPAYAAAESLDEARVMGGEEAPVWDPTSLVSSFPAEMWVSARDARPS